MSIIAETHCHTIACSHAYSTITENARAAAQKALRFLCITEHGPAMSDGSHEWFFRNLPQTIPDMLEGVWMLKGAEVNILDFDGKLDLCDKDLQKLDWIIASYHTVCIQPQTKAEHTRGWLSIAKNPLVDVIGHCGDARFDFDFDTVISAFGEYGKIVEINAHSFDCRPKSRERCREIALCCKKYGVSVVCSSDAHFHGDIASTAASEQMLAEIEFPHELILNLEYDRFLAVAREKTGRSFDTME